jgi:ADP-heptose:LPS heptosyltransferase
VLVILPSWVGDAVMATPALGLLRAAMPGAFLGGLARSGAAEALAGLDLLDEIHLAPASGIMAPKVAAQRVRTRRYDAAILLTNSFSTALSARLAGIPVRLGYDQCSLQNLGTVRPRERPLPHDNHRSCGFGKRLRQRMPAQSDVAQQCGFIAQPFDFIRQIGRLAAKISGQYDGDGMWI